MKTLDQVFKISLTLYNASKNRISAIREFVFNPGIGSGEQYFEET
ncbi:hypothetical protein LSO9J_70047 [Candidatus Liberibacter solanacearum]